MAGFAPQEDGSYGLNVKASTKSLATGSVIASQRSLKKLGAGKASQESLFAVQQTSNDKNAGNVPHQFNIGEDVKVGPNLKSSADLTGFPIFPPGTKSLLCKHLTRDMFKQLANVSDPHQFPFRDAIFSGCKNVDSGIGVYAGSHESYTTFAPLFDKIIEDYHQHKKTDIHQAEDPKVTLNAPDFPPDEAAMIVSTRIRVGRNLAGFPLGPALYANNQRKDIEAKAV